MEAEFSKMTMEDVDGTSMLNPSTPMPFEKYSEDSSIPVSECKELKTEIRKMNAASRVARFSDIKEIESLFRSKTCIGEVNAKTGTAMVAALKAHSAKDPVAAANKALKLCEVSEAYVVKAMYGSKSIVQAMPWFTKAKDVGLNCFSLLMAYKDESAVKLYNIVAKAVVQAMLATANCARKLGDYAYAEERFEHLRDGEKKNIFPFMFADWRFHMPEVLMRRGKFKEANALLRSDEYKVCFTNSSYPTLGGILWNLALLDYICNKKRGYDADPLSQEGDFDGERLHKASLASPIGPAIRLCPLVVEFLTGKVKLPNHTVPERIGTGVDSWTYAAEYARAYLPLWQKTPGAIEWAKKNANTVFLSSMLIVKPELKSMSEEFHEFQGLTTEDLTFKKLVEEGVFLDAKAPFFSDNQSLLHHALKFSHKRAKMLLNAGAKMTSTDPAFIIPGQYVVIEDLDPRCLQVLIEAGLDPYSTKAYEEKFGIPNPTDPLRSPVMLAAFLGHAHHLHTIFSLRPPDEGTFQDLLISLCHGSSGPCLSGEDKCHRCKIPSMKPFEHSKKASIALCITALLLTGYRLPQADIDFTKKLCDTTFKKSFVKSLEQQMKLSKDELLHKIESRYGKVIPYCAVCRSHDNPKKCVKCKSVYYCGSKCQKQDWKKHKVTCKKTLA